MSRRFSSHQGLPAARAHARQAGFIARMLGTVVLGVVVFIAMYRSLIAPPSNFPVPYSFPVDHGQSLSSVSRELKANGVIKSTQMFQVFMLTLGNDKQVSEGEYYFEKSMSAFEVAMRISGKQFGVSKQKVTFPEGFTTAEMAARLGATFQNFDTRLFLSLAEGKQGYLFPDTYGLFASTKPDMVISTMRHNFSQKIAPLSDTIAGSGHTQADIIIMASIIEKEANGPEDRAIVSGILWKRIAQGMALQVDAPFLYLLGKESKDLTLKDLAVKSPYNTYLNKGLPPTPINNPGLDAIIAAAAPVASPYLYYLHDSTGTIHYARTYAEHQQNIRTYLK